MTTNTPYDAQPWLAHYRVPPCLPLPQQTLLEHLESNALLRPQAPAIHYFEATLTWRELDDLATRCASWLASCGVGPGDRVALSLQNNPQFAIAQYGAWKRRAAIVPLSPMYKEEEIAYQLADSGAKVWIGLDSLSAADAGAAIRRTPTVTHALATSEDSFRAPVADPFLATLMRQAPDRKACAAASAADALHDLAHLVYTSGTTGRPKGSMGLHRHIAFNANVFRTWMALGEGDVVLGMAPLFHITGLVAHLGASAIAGIPLVLFHRFAPGLAIEMARRWQATFSVASITAYLALLNEPLLAAPGGFLSKCFTGGAPVAPAIAEQFAARTGSYIHNTYGLTEVNSPSHAVPLGAKAPVHPQWGALSIGLPIPNCQARIVDSSDPSRVVPPGDPGELALRGPFVFEGYWNNPEATAAAFHDGWFLTGDIAIMDPEGWFYIVDRKKDMINASGYKIWPREVEDVLYQHPSVREAAVVGIPDTYRGESVKAVLAVREPVEAREIIEFCRQRLAAYKVPRVVEFRDELPKTASGKFLRRQLRDTPGA